VNIDSIKNGIVIDHIKAGKSMEIYRFLGLDTLPCAVAVIQNATSRRMGKKDIIKIDSIIDAPLNALGFIDPDITIDVITDGVLKEKYHPELPDELVDIIKCHNPRCITSTEQELSQVFIMTDKAERCYRCKYCETKAK